MSDFGNYLLAKERTLVARRQYEAASLRIRLAEIEERLAEVRSQHLPLATFTDRGNTRDELLTLLEYVVFGRKICN